MRPVGRWTGTEACALRHALRHALRLTVRGYAEHLGVAVRTVSKWEAGLSDIHPLPDTQAILDTALNRAPEDAQLRFDLILGAQRDSEQAAQRDSDVRRREFPGTAAAVLGSVSPVGERCPGIPLGPRAVGRGDVAAVRDMASIFSRLDQRRGGGHACSLLVHYLTSDVASYLRGSYADDLVRKEMFSAAGELAYLTGWTAFDNAEHSIAQHYYTVAVTLAAEADNPPMAGHVLRATAHLAIDMGNYQQALEQAAASLDGKRYTSASPRERSLLGVIHARALCATGQKKAAATALIRAEDDLATAKSGDEEPPRVFFFGEASLAHETTKRPAPCGTAGISQALSGSSVAAYERARRTPSPGPTP